MTPWAILSLVFWLFAVLTLGLALVGPAWWLVAPFICATAGTWCLNHARDGVDITAEITAEVFD